jgi:hypothetical protein
METGEHDDYLAIAHTKVPFGCQVLCQSQNDFFLHLGLRVAFWLPGSLPISE